MSDIWHDPLFLAAVKKGGAGGSASGDIVTFNAPKAAPLKALRLAIDPVQDLHGYDSPWPGGGGKNKWHLYANGYYNSSGGFTPSGSNGCSDKIQVTVGATYVFGSTKATTETLTLRGYFFDENDAIVGSQIVGSSGSKSVSFTAPSGAVTVALWFSESGWTDTMTQTECDRLGMQMELGSTATTYAPYSNICPISGWDGANLWRTGKNLAKLSSENAGDNQKSTVSYTDSGAVVTATGTYGRYGWLIPVKAGGTYTISFKAVASDAENNNKMYFGSKTAWSVNSDGYLGWAGITITERQYSITVTVPTDTLFIGAYVSAAESSGSITISDLQVELSSTPTPYTPYTGTTIPITFTEAGTVYGGVWDVIGGVLRVTHAEVDLGTLEWSPWGNVEGLYGAGISDMKAPTTADERKTEIICSMYPVAATATMNNNFTDKSCARYQQNVFIRDTGYATADALTAALDGVQFVYPLATPLTYTLTPQQLDTLAGQNVVWGDSGEVSLEYAGGGVSTDMMLAAILHEARQ